uniref:Enspm-3 dr n=1 Tax=Rhipicephalus zambeziensis TaxID=60191 RepID=A0A224YW03_9ACAR
MHSCPRCPFSSAKFCKVVWHIRDHRHDTDFSVMCGVQGCAKTYREFESYRRHLYRCHRSYVDLDEAQQEIDVDESGVEVPRLDTATDGTAFDGTEMPCSSSFAGDTSDGRETACSAIIRSSDTVHDLALKVKKQMCLLFFRVAEVHKLPHSVTESIFEDFKGTFLEIMTAFASQVRQNIPIESTGAELQKLLACDFLEDVFQSASTKSQRANFAKEHLPYVKPEEHHLGVNETFQYVSIPRVLENLMVSETFREQLDKNFSTGQPSLVFRSFYDGLLFKERLSALLEDGAQCTLFLILYSDELEIVNPLGSKRGIHKVIVVYFSVLNIHARHRAQLRCIHVALVAPYRLVDKHGMNAILKPVVSDIATLETTGFSVRINSATINVRAILVAFSGDNLSMNRLGGFTCCFNRGRPCRFCTAPYATFGAVSHEMDVQIRNRHLHETHIQGAKVNQPLSTALYGVKGESPLLSIGYFDVTLQLPPDLMHDVLEGSIPHVLKHVLQGLVSSNVIGYSDLDCITSFSFGAHDRKNKPQAVEKHFLTGKTPYKGTASQKWCLFRFLSLMLGDDVPELNEHWEVYLLLRRIVDLIFADNLPRDHLACLQDDIRYFLSSFVSLYPGHIIPKLHFLVHYPRLINELGPLKQYWCMRYEAKHQYVKAIAVRNQNFKNICKTIAERHQLLQSYELCNPEFHNSLQTTKPRPLKEEDLAPCMAEVVSPGVPVWQVNSVTVEQLTYKLRDVVILQKGLLPTFGQITHLYIYCGNVFLLVNVLGNTLFNRHRWSYVVQKTGEQKLVKPTDLASSQILDLYFDSELVLRPEVMLTD